jgi:hypothetical protein
MDPSAYLHLPTLWKKISPVHLNLEICKGFWLKIVFIGNYPQAADLYSDISRLPQPHSRLRAENRGYRATTRCPCRASPAAINSQCLAWRQPTVCRSPERKILDCTNPTSCTRRNYS